MKNRWDILRAHVLNFWPWLALCLGRVLLNRILSCTCYGLKCRRCIKDVKICDLPLYTERRLRLKLPFFLFIDSLYWLPSSSCCRPTCLILSSLLAFSWRDDKSNALSKSQSFVRRLVFHIAEEISYLYARSFPWNMTERDIQKATLRQTS
jgi:hypothetical protein